MNRPLLEVDNLVIEFETDRGTIRAVDGISFCIGASETLGLVGESGCGKSVTALALLGLIPSPPGRVAAGSIRLDGRELTGLSEARMRKVRGKDIAMIFQEPMSALNPVFTIASQMTRVIRRHQGLSRRQARAAAVEMLALTGIAAPLRLIDDYPHQLSGGMRQRVMIAMAMSCEPKLLIADEPTTALDVTTQAQVLEQILALQSSFNTAVILITHDLGVVAETCSRALVMYCGRLAEEGTVESLFAHPRHPYTAGLLESIPALQASRNRHLPTIAGAVPDLAELPPGCLFADRCPSARSLCREEHPRLITSGRDGRVACHFPVQSREAYRAALVQWES